MIAISQFRTDPVPHCPARCPCPMPVSPQLAKKRLQYSHDTRKKRGFHSLAPRSVKLAGTETALTHTSHCSTDSRTPRHHFRLARRSVPRHNSTPCPHTVSASFSPKKYPLLNCRIDRISNLAHIRHHFAHTEIRRDYCCCDCTDGESSMRGSSQVSVLGIFPLGGGSVVWTAIVVVVPSLLFPAVSW